MLAFFFIVFPAYVYLAVGAIACMALLAKMLTWMFGDFLFFFYRVLMWSIGRPLPEDKRNFKSKQKLSKLPTAEERKNYLEYRRRVEEKFYEKRTGCKPSISWYKRAEWEL